MKNGSVACKIAWVYVGSLKSYQESTRFLPGQYQSLLFLISSISRRDNTGEGSQSSVNNAGLDEWKALKGGVALSVQSLKHA